MITDDQKKWATSIIQKFMDGAKVAHADLAEACTRLDLTVKEVRNIRRKIGSIARGRDPRVVLTPCGGKVAA